MAEPSSILPARRSGIARKLLFAAAGLAIALVVLFFVVTSSAFLKAVVLPRVGPVIGARITADEVQLSPLSQLVLRDAKVQTTGAQPLLTAHELRVRYRLLDLVRGDITMPAITVVAPSLQVVQNADGTCNLDPILAAFRHPAKTKQPGPPSPAKPLQLDLRNVALRQAALRWVQLQKDGSQQSLQVSNLNLIVDTLANGRPGKVTLDADAQLVQKPAKEAGTNVMQLTIAGTYQFALDPALTPKSIHGALQLTVAKATGTFAELAALRGALDCDVTPADIRQLALQFSQAGHNLGQVQLHGRFDLARTQGHLNLEIRSIDRHVLNLIGAARGWDFGPSVLNATAQIDLASNANAIAASGRLTGRQLSIRQRAGATPPLDLDAEYQFNLDLAARTALISRFSLLGKQDGRDLVQATMTRPIRLSWGGPLTGLPDSAWELQVTNLHLGDWQPLLEHPLPRGTMNVDLKVLAQQGGHQLKSELTASLQKVTAAFGTNRVALDEADAQLEAQLNDFKKVTVPQFKLEARQPDQTLLTATGSADYQLDTHSLDTQTTLDASVPGALRLFPLPGLIASAGDLRLTLHMTRNGPDASGTGHLQLSDFTGSCGDYPLRQTGLGADFDVALAGSQASLKRLVLTLQQEGQPAGRCEISGQYDLANQTGQTTFELSGLNQEAIAPFLAARLAPAQLTSLALSATGNATYNPHGDSAITAEVDVAHLVVRDPQHRFPTLPLNARWQVDASLRQPWEKNHSPALPSAGAPGAMLAMTPQSVVTVKKSLLALSVGGGGPTAIRRAGQFSLSGQYHPDTRAAHADFKLTDLNQNILASFLAPRLAPARLSSVTINAEGSATYNPQAASSLEAQLQTTNLLVVDPQQRLPQKPWGALVKLDAAMQKQAIDLRALRLVLPPTARAQNELVATGKVDFARAGAATGALSVSADSLDLTPLYDLLSRPSATQAPLRPSPTAFTPPATAAPGTEPAPLKLPCRQLAADLNVGRLYLRQIIITNLTAAATIDSGTVTLKPFQLTLNGAPVSANAAVNLGVPGYTYDFALKAEHVPLAPLADSFSPTYSGQANGDLFADLKLKGAGLSGADLRQNLTGHASLSLTNANIKLVSPRMNVLLTPVAYLLRVSEILQSPLNAVYANLDAGDGQIHLEQVGIESGAFHAYTHGTITLADVLTNSPINQLPVDFYLERGIAARAHLLTAGTSADAAFVKLPNFLTVVGTLGAPKAKTDDLRITALIAGSASGFVGGKVGNILQGIGGILSGGQPTLTNPQTNAAPATNPPPNVPNPLNLFRNLFKKH